MKKYQINNFKYIKSLKNNPTKCEIIVKNWMEENNIYFIFQKGFLLPFHRIVDFYIPKKKIIIEIDGDYHKSIIDKDNFKDISFLKKRGFKTIRINNNDVLNGNFKTILQSYLESF